MCIRDSAKEHGIHRTNLVITYVVFEVVQFKLSHQLDHQGNWAPCCPEWQHSPSGVGCQVFPRGGQLLPPPIAPCTLSGHFPASSLPLCTLVPAAQGLRHKGEESDPLLSALLLSPPELPVVGEV